MVAPCAAFSHERPKIASRARPVGQARVAGCRGRGVGSAAGRRQAGELGIPLVGHDEDWSVGRPAQVRSQQGSHSARQAAHGPAGWP